MYNRLVIDGNVIYEVDDECLKRKQGRKGCGGKNRGTGNVYGSPGSAGSEK